MKTFKNNWLVIFGVMSLLFSYRFVFTHSFATGTVIGITNENFLFVKSKVLVITFIAKDNTKMIARYFDDTPDYKVGEAVQVIYRSKRVSYFEENGIKTGSISGSWPLPIFYDTNMMLSNSSVWLNNFLCWSLLMAVVIGIRRLRLSKMQNNNV